MIPTHLSRESAFCVIATFQLYGSLMLESPDYFFRVPEIRQATPDYQYAWPSNGGNARFPKRTGFRENPTNGQTDRRRRIRTTTITLAAHARRGNYQSVGRRSVTGQISRDPLKNCLKTRVLPVFFSMSTAIS